MSSTSPGAYIVAVLIRACPLSDIRVVQHLLLALLLLVMSSAWGTQTTAANSGSEAGLPALQTFAPADYAGGGQNWAVIQDRRQLIYVGNDAEGVLEFDGVRWRRIQTDNRTTVRSLALAADGTVYVGAQGELGYLAPSANGELGYVSLMARIPADQRDFADVWQTFVMREDVYFVTPSLLFRLRDGHIRSWRSPSPVHISFLVGERVFLRSFGVGLLELIDDQLKPVPGGERFAEEKIYQMLPWKRADGTDTGEILVGTRTQGFLIFDGRQFRPWRTEVDAALPNALLYTARWLEGGDLAMGTLQAGLTVVDRDGRQRLHLARDAGLGSNTVYSMHQDRQRGLWLALDAGVARVSLSSPLTRFDQRNGLVGAVLAITRHAGQLYVGTHEGLFRLVSSPGANARFVQVPGLSSMVWACVTIDDALLVATRMGVSELRDGVFRPVLQTEGEAIALVRSRIDPARVFISSGLGIAAIRRENGRWIQESLKMRTGSGTYSLLEDEAGRIWMGSQGVNVYRMSFPGLAPGRPLPEPRVERFGAAAGVPPGRIDVLEIGGKPTFATASGMMQFDEARSRLVPMPGAEQVFPDGLRAVGPAREDPRGRLWMYSQNNSTGSKEVGFATRDRDGMYRWTSAPFRSISGIVYTALYIDDDGVAWLGSEDALSRYDPRVKSSGQQRFHALIRKVSGRNDRVLYGGAGTGGTLELPDDENALRFEFAAPTFDSMKATRFQVFLEGVDTEWSALSAEGYRDYTKIPPGLHRFRVRAENVDGAISEEAVFEFRILRPWYLTWWAWTAYAVCVVALVAAITRWRSASLMRRNLELAALVEQRTGELSEANSALREQSLTDPLTGLKNRRFVLDHIDTEIALVDRAYAGAAPGERCRNADLLFLLVDIDHFKEINDRYGHAAGDQVLRQFRELLLSVSRKVDIPVRWGGEEFLLIARNVDLAFGEQLAERIRSIVASHEFDLGKGMAIYRTCSIGFAGYPFFRQQPQRLGWEQVVDVADQALYLAKRRGRNAWVGVRASDAPIPDDLDERLHAGIEALAGEGLISLSIFGDGV